MKFRQRKDNRSTRMYCRNTAGGAGCPTNQYTQLRVPPHTTTHFKTRWRHRRDSRLPFPKLALYIRSDSTTAVSAEWSGKVHAQRVDSSKSGGIGLFEVHARLQFPRRPRRPRRQVGKRCVQGVRGARISRGRRGSGPAARYGVGFGQAGLLLVGQGRTRSAGSGEEVKHI